MLLVLEGSRRSSALALRLQNTHIKFPLPHSVQRTSEKQYKTIFRAERPSTIH